MIGKKISHYQITGKLGAGGMGVVYKAHDTRLDRDVAIKFLPPELDADASVRTRFMQEARAASALDHANITTVFDIDQTDDGQMFIVMAYHDGRSLREVIDAGIPDTTTALDIVAQIASGLARAHEGDIVHRDIKPGNILITSKNEVRIVDFGLAKLAGQTRVTREGSTVGTAAYMSPEQGRGEDVDGRSDLFSLGVVLYELLTGALPFKGDHEAAMLYNIVHTDPAPLGDHRDDLPPELQAIVTRALEKNADARYESATELADDLERVTYHTPGGASPGSSPGRGWKLRVIVAAVVVLAAGYVAWDRYIRDDEELPPPQRSARPTTQIEMSQATFRRGVEEFPAFSPDGGRLAFCAEGEGGLRQVFVKDMATGTETQITTEASDHIQVAWAADGKSLVFVRAREEGTRLEPGDVFGQYSDGDIWTRHAESGDERKIVERAFAPALSPDGKKLAFDAAWGGSHRIYVAGRNGRNPAQVTTDSSEAAAHLGPKWSRDGLKLVFVYKKGTRFDIQAIHLSTRNQVWVTDDLFKDVNPVWDPSADVIYFSSARTGGLNVWRVPVDDTGVPAGPLQQVTTGPGQDVQIAFSPDGARLAMTIMHQNADLYALPVMPMDGTPAGEPYSLVSTTREDSRGSWSPDAKVIAFNSDRSGHMNIWIRAIVGAGERQITKGPGGDYQPDWSRDMRRLVFFSSRAGNADIWEVDIQSGALIQLTKGPALDRNPAYSPNGSLIAYQSDVGGRMELWVMRHDGREQRQVSTMGASGHFVMWLYDSDRIVFGSPSREGSKVFIASVAGGTFEEISVNGGWHMSKSPDERIIMDVTGHKTLWTSPIGGGDMVKIFEFDDPDYRIDYPKWSPDGKNVMFDLVTPGGGDIWVIEGM